jgi:hypothetical protein
MSNNIRIRTTPNGGDKYIGLKLEQDFDFIEILSLNISQDKAYENFCSDYGVLVGRVVVNNGFGVPNAKVSIFIPITDEDKLKPEVLGLYPYESVTDTNGEGVVYNLLPKENQTGDPCYTPVGTFPSKNEILDNPEILDIYKKYYKYTAVTNYAGDYMIFGIPVGNHIIHIDVDISDIGILSQKPFNLIDQGTPKELFINSRQFNTSKNLSSLPQIKSTNFGVNIKPFWGDTDSCQIGINRFDYNLNYNLTPTAFFMGGIFGDSEKNSVNKNCRPRKNVGVLCEQVASQGIIEMIRKTPNNSIERFNVAGSTIDDDGAWAYQIPMNLDYYTTDELGNLVPSNDPNIGIPTRSRVRFRVTMFSGSEGLLRTRAKHLIPHNPQNIEDIDFNFDSETKDSSFVDLYWNKVYTPKNFISRVQPNTSVANENNISIKDVDSCNENQPFPYNRANVYSSAYEIYILGAICIIVGLIGSIVFAINAVLCLLRDISIFGFKPFGFIKPITLACPTEPTTYYTPGCNFEGLEAYTDCYYATIFENIGIYKLDFYNDWVNGSLYFFLLKYKKKRRASKKEKFCDTNCDKPNSSNNCNTNYMLDNLLDVPVVAMLHKVKHGYITKYKNNLYYSPIMMDGSNKRLYPTDIVNLGSVLDYDWQGIPKIVNLLESTSYNIPPLVEEKNDDGTITSGMFTLGKQSQGLFFNVNCTGVNLGRDIGKATNIRRQCEIFVDVPETNNQAENPIKYININQIYGYSEDDTAENSSGKFFRDVFYTLNINGPATVKQKFIPNDDLNDEAKGTSFGITRNNYNDDHNIGVAYRDFRKYNEPYNQGEDLAFQSWGNSYYFYFGLKDGRTGLDKFKDKYLSTCIPFISDDFIISTVTTQTNTTTSSDGTIIMEIIGGSQPFTYTITNPNYTLGPISGYTGAQTIISNLSGGTYTITVTDITNATITKEVSVSSPSSLSIDIYESAKTTTPLAEDGQITVQISGGKPPYKLVMSGSKNLTDNDFIITDSPIKDLKVGNYEFTVTDSSSPQQTQTASVRVTSSVNKLEITSVVVDDATCSQSTGSIIVDVSGGTSDGRSVKIEFVGGPNSSFETKSFSISQQSRITIPNLPPNKYKITATDSSGQIFTKNDIILVKYLPMTINTRNIPNEKQCDPNKYTVSFNLEKPTIDAPYILCDDGPYTIKYSIDSIDQTPITTLGIGIQTLEITQNISNSLEIYVNDNKDCQSSKIFIPESSIRKPSSALTIIGGSYTGPVSGKWTITWNVSGGIPPYTISPSTSGLGNQLVVSVDPSGKSYTVTATDNVGCQIANLVTL